jgi:protein-tyrosine phosphatase
MTVPAALNFDWLTDRLAVGGCFPIDAAQRLARDHGIRHVVDLRAEACDQEVALRRHGVALLHLPTEDNCAIAPDMLRAGVRWVCAALDAGDRVLVHCEHGIGRSALLALAVLIARGTPPLEALERAKRARRVVSPSPEQLRALIAFARQVRAASGAAWEVPTFDALATIAYRHLDAATCSSTAIAS